MKIYPVIDIKNGNAIRLRQGHLFDLEVYSHFPAKVAEDFESQGASYIHIVDVDGALLGHSVNAEIIKEIVESISIPVQVGGGMRTIKDIDYMLSLGVSRVIVGTKAVEDPAFIKEAVNIFGSDRIMVGIDARNGMVAIEGWERMSTYNTISLAKKMQEIGVTRVVYTDILKDGMFTGPSVETAKEIKDTTGLEVILSGGVSSIKDLEEASKHGLDGMVIGKALYEKRVELRNAIELFEKEKSE